MMTKWLYQQKSGRKPTMMEKVHDHVARQFARDDLPRDRTLKVTPRTWNAILEEGRGYTASSDGSLLVWTAAGAMTVLRDDNGGSI